jgi:hypothetical protein
LKSYKKERRILITLWESLTRFDQPKKGKNQAKPRPVGENVIIAITKSQQITTLQHRNRKKTSGSKKTYNYYKNETKNSFLFF